MLPHTTGPEAPQELESWETAESVTPDLKNPKDPELVSPEWSGPERAPRSFSHLLLPALRHWRLCAPRIFSRSVHSNAQRQSPDWRRASRITSTKYDYFDKIGFEPQIPAHPNPPLCIRGASGHQPNPQESRNLSLGPASDPQPHARLGSSFFPRPPATRNKNPHGPQKTAGHVTQEFVFSTRPAPLICV